MKTIRLTPTEIEILQHRLEVPETIADALEEEHDRETVERCAESLRYYLKNCREIVLGQDAVADAILADCCNGSTFFGSSEDAVALGEITRGKLLNWQRAAASLEKKFESAGINVSIPRE